MDYAAWSTYFVALAALTAAPGPIIAVLIARAVSRDGRGAVAFATGLCLGDVIGVCAVALGIGVWAEAKPELFAVVKYLGIVYLLWLAVGIWNARVEPARTKAHGWVASAGAGAALCLGNPATFLIYMLLLPNVAPHGIAGIGHLGLLLLVTFAAVAVVFFGAIVLATQLNRVIASPSSSVLVSRITAVVIGMTSLWMVAA